MACNCKRTVTQPARNIKTKKQDDTAKNKTTVAQTTNSERNNNSIYSFYGM